VGHPPLPALPGDAGQVGGDVGERVGTGDEPQPVAPLVPRSDIILKSASWGEAIGGGGVSEEVLEPLPWQILGPTERF
jgi:hypothetical protein